MTANIQQKTDFEYIDTADALARFCAAISGQPWVALDTEFLREKTYYPKLCLIQVATPVRIACIDPIALDNIEPLLDIFYDSQVTKVVHAASQDMEIFALMKHAVPAPIFDTQVAAPLLGLPDQMGYGNFIRELLGVSLSKTQSRTDWSRRPLSEAQLGYAADDVRYLAQAYPKVLEKLANMGRLEWLKPEFDQLEQVERYLAPPQQAWMRVRGLDKLNAQALSIAQLLAEWREQTAQDKNLPRGWVFRDDALIDIARIAPSTLDDLLKLRTLNDKTTNRYGTKLLDLVQQGSGRAPEPYKNPKIKRKKPSAQDEALADILQAQLRLLAEKHKINSATLASRKDLIAVVQGEENVPVLKGWRRGMVGEKLLALKNGQYSVSINDGDISIHQSVDFREPTDF